MKRMEFVVAVFVLGVYVGERRQREPNLAVVDAKIRAFKAELRAFKAEKALTSVLPAASPAPPVPAAI